MGLARTVNTSYGLLGLAYDTNEALVSTGRLRNQTVTPYPSFVDQLVAQNLTNLKVYSAYLSPDSSAGSLLFGGVDTAKYTYVRVRLNV